MKIYNHKDDGENLPDGSGTTFYTITEDQLLKHYDKAENLIVRNVVSDEGFKAFDLDSMYGSKIIDDTLYLCVTDGMEITVNGNEVDPEFALEDYSISDLSKYIKEGDDTIINRYVSEYELKDIDLNKVAIDILDGGAVTFTDVVKYAADLDLLDDII